MPGHVALHVERLVDAKALAQIPGEGGAVDQRFRCRHVEGQARPPVAGFVVPPDSMALARLRAMTIRCTSDGPS